MRKTLWRPLGLLPLFVLILGTGAHADRFSALAADNATVWPAGPRPGDNGKRFFNIEGNQGGQFASFGVADFDAASLGIHSEIESIRSLTVTLVQANASFTHDGLINFWLTTDTATDIQPSDDPVLRFDRDDDPDGLAGQLAPRFFLGSSSFVQVDDGQVDIFAFRIPREARRYLLRQLTHRGHLRVVVSPADGTVAATYAGYANMEFSGPVITVEIGEDD